MSLGVWFTVPTFEDSSLRVPAPPHRLSCGALRPKPRICRCGTPGPTLDPQPLSVVGRQGFSVRVQPEGWSPVWIEAASLRPWKSMAPVRGALDTGPPQDALDLEEWLIDHGKPHIGRRRREPGLGELVWVRADFRAQASPTPWRLFTKTAAEALLVRPTIPLAKLTEASSDEVLRVALNGGTVGQALMPVVPYR
jgi:hypothetical protein